MVSFRKIRNVHDKKCDIIEFEIKYSYFLKKILIKLRGIYLKKKKKKFYRPLTIEVVTLQMEDLI